MEDQCEQSGSTCNYTLWFFSRLFYHIVTQVYMLNLEYSLFVYLIISRFMSLDLYLIIYSVKKNKVHYYYYYYYSWAYSKDLTNTCLKGKESNELR